MPTQQLINRRYRLVEKLGQGGMGAVYLASDRLTGQNVALKLVSGTAFNENDRESLDYRLSLANEFKTLATLRHPHIINVIDYGFDEDQQPYFTMEIMDGARSIIEAERNKPESSRTRRLIELLQAVAYLHRRRILHRDLKPGNVLISKEGMLKVLDFGLATDTDQAEELAGTLAYLAPELLQGVGISTASDLYAIGVMAFELYTGRHPYHEALASDAGAGALINALLLREPDLSLLDSERLEKQGADSSYLESGTRRTSGVDLDAQTARLEDRQEEINAVLNEHTIPIDIIGHDSEDLDQTVQFDVLENTAPLEDLADTTQRFTVLGDRHVRQEANFVDQALSLKSVIGKLLAKSPDTRYGDAYKVIDDLCEALGQEVPLESAAIRESFLQTATFVERSDELDILTNALEGTFQKQGSTWLVGGESGVGKSRLLDEMRIRALVRGVTVLRGKESPSGRQSYQLWRDPLRRLVLTTELDELDASIFKDIVPDIAQLLEYPVDDPPRLEGKEYTQRLHGAVASLFQRQTSPLVLLLEDLQWADESLEVLSVLNSMVSGLPLLIIGSFRTEEKPELPDALPDMTLLRLGRLSRDGIAQMSGSIFGRAGQDMHLLDFLHNETGGNAYFIVEVLRQLGEKVGRLDLGEVALDSLRQYSESGGIQSVIRNRLDKVAGLDRDLLNIAAVIGREIDLDLLKRLRPEADLDDWLITCSNYAILETMDEQWQFAHGKLRDSLLSLLSDDQQIDLHTEAALGLEELYPGDDSKAAQIAQHWHEARNLVQECVFSYRAGLYALKLSIFQDARAGLERTLEILEQLEDPDKLAISRGTVLFSLGEVLMYLAEYDLAQDRAGSALELYGAAKDQRGIAYAHRLLADIAWYQREYAYGLEHCAMSLDICRELGDDLGIVRALNRTGMIYLDQSEYDVASEYFADGLATARKLDEKGDLAVVLNNIGLVHYFRAKFDEAAQYWEESIAISRETGERQRVTATLINLGAIAGINQNYDQAQSIFLEALSIAREIGNRRFSAQCLNNLGYLSDLQGEYERAEMFYQESWPIAEAIGMRQQVALTLGNIGDVKRNQGQLNLALHYYQEALSIADEFDATPQLLEILLKIARITEDPIGQLIICKALMEQQAIPEDVRRNAEELYNNVLADLEGDLGEIPSATIKDIVASLIDKE